jgi:hypothetical protein
LIKRCRHKSAIVGYGVTTGREFEDDDFEDPRKRSTYVRIKVVSFSLEQMLPTRALRLLGIKLPWEFQGAMCRIDPVMGERVRSLFDAMQVKARAQESRQGAGGSRISVLKGEKR